MVGELLGLVLVGSHPVLFLDGMPQLVQNSRQDTVVEVRTVFLTRPLNVVQAQQDDRFGESPVDVFT